jgi:S-adenosylmethionine:tRNA ribosyltransferase-isomerase
MTKDNFNKEYSLEDFGYNLPDHLIAQTPPEKRSDSRLLVVDRETSRFTHTCFSSLENFLQSGDLLIFNNTRVLHARIFCERIHGGKIELVLTRKINDLLWLTISNRTGRLKTGELIYPKSDKSISLKILGRDGEYLKIESSKPLTDDVLKKIGNIPLPPYIKRELDKADNDRYQTVYASESGAVAAPTAGLHFTDEILDNISRKGVETLFLTLHVSWGTFSPVRNNNLANHKMHSEVFHLSEATASALNTARKEGRRIIAVGTTTLRVLESIYKNSIYSPGSGETDIFIYPPRKILSVNGLITNLHTPYSTLLMLVASFAGYDLIMEAYKEAVKKKYRFFSYGDSMLIL